MLKFGPLKRAKPLPLTPHPAPPCASEEVQTLKQQLAEEAMRARELKELAGTRQEDLVKHQQQLALAKPGILRQTRWFYLPLCFSRVKLPDMSVQGVTLLDYSLSMGL
jgi:hypothetical protein